MFCTFFLLLCKTDWKFLLSFLISFLNLKLYFCFDVISSWSMMMMVCIPIQFCWYFFREENGEKEYLVKWKELSYDECYWESESDISSFQHEIERFRRIQSRHKGSSAKQKASLDEATEGKKRQKEFQHYESTEFLSGGKNLIPRSFFFC